MAKLVTLIMLILFSLLLLKANITALSSSVESPKIEKDKKNKNGNYASKDSPSYNPKVSRDLPNPNNGYLFNSERHLEGNNSEEQGIADDGLQVNIYEIHYDGSLILGKTKKALISYPVGKKVSGPIRSNTLKSKRKYSVQRSSIKMSLGDKLSGYTLSAIAPQKIVFSRGTENVEKLLYDQEKQRIVATGKALTKPRKIKKINNLSLPKKKVVKRPAARHQAIKPNRVPGPTLETLGPPDTPENW